MICAIIVTICAGIIVGKCLFMMFIGNTVPVHEVPMVYEENDEFVIACNRFIDSDSKLIRYKVGSTSVTYYFENGNIIALGLTIINRARLYTEDTNVSTGKINKSLVSVKGAGGGYIEVD